MRIKRNASSLVILLVAAIGLVTALKAYMKPYPPDAAALDAMRGGGGIAVTESKEWIVFEPEKGKQPDVIFYPGQLVGPASYAPLAHSLAEEGYRTWIIKMPLNLALLGIDRARKVIETLPGQTYVIGGHSLGGAMAARFAYKHADRLNGIFFLAAYTNGRANLKAASLPVLSMTGSVDGVMNRRAFEMGKAYLPEQTDYAEITGGNHAQFGSYGMQKGDNPALITPDKQRSITVSLLVNWLERIEHNK